MTRVFDAAQVARHNTVDSCWVILYGKVYDVTDFLDSHPGGPAAILSLAGKDATEEYDPIHPPGVLEENLKPEAFLGTISAVETAEAAANPPSQSAAAPSPAHTLLSLDDIEHEARRRLPRRAWAYFWSASDDMLTKRLNSAVYRAIHLRPRILVDVTALDTSTVLLGRHAVRTPVFVAPAAMARLAHPDGERAIARAAARFGAMQIVSHNASMTPEQIVEGAGRDQLFGWQLYVQEDRARSEAMLRRVAATGRYGFVCLTVDAPVPGKRETDEREALGQRGQGGGGGGDGGGIGRQLFRGTAGDLTWEETLGWLARRTDLPIVLKGVQTHEDVGRAARFPRVRAVILSNHGGRALDTAAPALHTLLEVRRYCPEVMARMEVWIDGGVRRGTDVVKALCLGARAVGVGRAPLYGLGAGGQGGVERMFEILQGEISTAMRLVGATTISGLGPRCVNARRVERDIYDGEGGDDGGLWKGKM